MKRVEINLTGDDAGKGPPQKLARRTLLGISEEIKGGSDIFERDEHILLENYCKEKARVLTEVFEYKTELTRVQQEPMDLKRVREFLNKEPPLG